MRVNWMVEERRRGRHINRQRHSRPRDPIDWTKVLLKFFAVLMMSLFILGLVEKLDHRIQRQSSRRSK